MSKVLLPQKAQLKQQQLQQQQENSTTTKPKIMMASSTQIKLSKETQNLQNFTTPKQTNSEKFPQPASPSGTIDFDDFTSSSSIMEFLKQEQKCGGPDDLSNGHDSEIDAESIFQEVSRLADNSDTRSVDELLREAELLLQHHHFMDNFAQNPKKKNSKPAQALKTQTQSTIQMNSKYTKSIENVKPPNMVNKLINGYVDPTPETPTPTNPLSTGSNNNTFNAFVDNLPSESVLSEESVPLDLQGTTTASVKSSSSSNNTTGKDITTKQMDGDDTDDGTDTQKLYNNIVEGSASISNLRNCATSTRYVHKSNGQSETYFTRRDQ
ncbi:uncharacterized protein LOC119612453 [Lucilia sericata]|uniref:uncharacterized protein LOC119612453 n=1 Tax=Lucilia sericata TaxID=13632 RepID=UPI0018A7FFC8|nr:uncharacterized protein LOC119612453 [Lucilia sericata]